MYIKTFNLIVVAFILHLVCANAYCHGQVLNGEFDNQSATSPEGWYGHGGCQVSQTAEQVYNGTYSALVSERTAFWNGAAQELNGDLTIGKDYHFRCWVRTKTVPSGVIRIEITQRDDRGDRYTTIAKVLANNSDWSLLEGGFHLLANGDLDDLRFVIGSDFPDEQLFDFYVDSVTITENNWRAAADERIEQLRKRDVVLALKDADGDAVGNVEVNIQQVGHRFAFGSTLNDGFTSFSVYADFFKQNFEWATIEYYAQWKPVEEQQGTEDYTRADASVEFAEANGIKIRGHSLAWPDPRFVPSWLEGKSAEFHRAAINQRIDSVVSRYAGQLVHWDVVNEMLNYTYYQDHTDEDAGSNIRAEMFKWAKEKDPDVKLFTNEFGLTDSGYKSSRYRELIKSLQAEGADVGGIGLQSHFDSNVSPKAMELTLAKLTDLGPEIWFTEFDAANPDENERAKLLETFYRYAFSVPEAEGIIMWGFWAGNHWRGADSAIVDQDWTINAAGRKYFELMDEWTTNLTAKARKAKTELRFRGFHGNYVVTTRHNGVLQHHVISVVPDQAGQASPQTIALRLIDDTEADGAVTVYGTDDDDVIKFDFDNPGAIEINNVLSNIPVLAAEPNFTVVGNDGEDRFDVYGNDDAKRFLVSLRQIAVIGTSTKILFPELEDFRCFAGSRDDQMIFRDSVIDDQFVSYPDVTKWLFEGRTLAAEGFSNLICVAKKGHDRVTIYGSTGEDQIRSNFDNYVLLRSGDLTRQFRGFDSNELDAADGEDYLFGALSDSPTQISGSMFKSKFSHNSTVFNFTGVEKTSVSYSGDEQHVAVLDVSEDAANDSVVAINNTISIRQGTDIGFVLTGVRNIRSLTAANDRLVFLGSRGDDILNADSDGFLFLNHVFAIDGQGAGVTFAIADQQGTSTAVSSGNPPRLKLIGDWIGL